MDLHRLGRPLDGRIVAGVAAGLARALALDVTLVRLIFLLLALASGLGLLLYVALWLLLPAEDAPGGRSLGSVVQDNLRGLGDDLRRIGAGISDAWSRRGGDPRGSRRWIALGLISGGLLVFLYSLGLLGWLGAGRILGLVVILAGAAMLINDTSRRRERS